jgi:Tol biopolymer transport system component
MALQGVLWIMDANGGEAEPITAPELDAHEPVWAPSGSKIAFYAYAENGFSVFVVDPSGANLTRITPPSFDARYPKWDPTGNALYYASDKEGGYSIYRQELTSQEAVKVVDAVAQGYAQPDKPYFRGSGNAVYPASHPEGKALAYVVDGPKDRLMVTTDGLDSSTLIESDLLGPPAWDKSGDSIYIVTIDAGVTTLLKVPVSTGAPEVFARSKDLFPFRPSVANDGSVLFTGDGKILKKTPQKQTSLIPFSAEVQLARIPYARRKYDLKSTGTNYPALGVIDPVVASDERHIVFAALGDLWLVDDLEGKPTQLTDDEFIDLSPALSPDGTAVAWVSDRSGKAEIWVMDLASRATRQITEGSNVVNSPIFSNGGTKLAFLRDSLTSIFLGAEVVTLDLKTGEEKVISPPLFGPSAPAWAPDDSTISVYHRAPSNSRFREGLNVVRLMSATGKGASIFTSPVPDASLGRRQFNRPAWSSEGNFVYPFRGGLWMASLSSSGEFGPSRLIVPNAENPSWSPNGKLLAFLKEGKITLLDLQSGKERAIPVPEWTRSFPEEEFTLLASNVFDGKAQWAEGKYLIHVSGGLITGIDSYTSQPLPSKTIDLGDGFLMPGLIESHTHQSTSQGIALGQHFLCHGITTVRETGDDPFHAVERREAQASGRRRGPRVFTAGPLNEGSRVSYGVSETVGDLETLRNSMKLSEALELDLYKSYVRQDYATQKQAIQLAHQQGIPVTSHELFPALANGADYLEHLGATSRRGFSLKQSRLGWAYDDVIQLITRTGVTLVPTVAMTERPGRDMSPAFNTLRRISEGGGNIVAGTDSPFIAHGTALQRELELYKIAGLSTTEVLRAATARAASALGAGDSLGLISTGYLADLIVLKKSPFEDISNIRKLSRVIQNGAEISCSASDLAWRPDAGQRHAH